MSLAQTPPGLPLTRRLPAGLACRGQPAGPTCRGSRRGSPLPAKGPRRASAAAPASGTRLFHVWSTRHRNPAVRNGLQRTPAVDRSRRLQTRSCGNRRGGRTLIRMRSQVQVLEGPLAKALPERPPATPGTTWPGASPNSFRSGVAYPAASRSTRRPGIPAGSPATRSFGPTLSSSCGSCIGRSRTRLAHWPRPPDRT